MYYCAGQTTVFRHMFMPCNVGPVQNSVIKEFEVVFFSRNRDSKCITEIYVCSPHESVYIDKKKPTVVKDKKCKNCLGC